MSFFTRTKRSITTSAPVKYIVRQSKIICLPGFSGIPLYDVINFFHKQISTTGLAERTSAIAFNFVMALPPAIIFLFTLIPFFPISEAFEQELYSLVKDVVPGQSNNGAIIAFMQDFINKPRTGLLSAGFLLSLFFSSNAVIGIMRSFDKKYSGFRKRKSLETRGVALKITLFIFLAIITGIALIVSRKPFLHWLGVTNHTLINIINNLRWVVIVLLFFSTISLIYRYAPAVHKKWKFVNPGSILATFLSILFTVGFSWWVNHFGNYNELYGSIGTLLILMILIYLNSLVLLIGFELNVSINSLKKIVDERKNNVGEKNESTI